MDYKTDYNGSPSGGELSEALDFIGAPGGNRTHDHLLRRQMLYPTELRAQAFVMQ